MATKNKKMAFPMYILFFCANMSIVMADGLFSEDTYKPLLSDRKARSVGDTVTVIIFENSTASASTGADTKSESGVDITSGLDVNLPRIPRVNRDPKGKAHLNANLDAGNHFDGKGSLNRAGKMVARVSATITEVLSNGSLRLRGQQNIELNSEVQKIKISGLIRPDDIAPDNTVLSTRIAEQDLKYVGEGLLSTQVKPGLFTRIVQWLF